MVVYPLALGAALYKWGDRQNGLFASSWIMLLAIAVLFMQKQIEGVSLFDTLYWLRLWFGFIVFYFYFLSNRAFDPKCLFLLLAGVTLVEVVAINTVIEPASLPNYFRANPFGGISSTNTPEIGSYIRPVGFGGSSTVTGALLVGLWAYCWDGMKKWESAFVLVAIVSVFSGTAFALLAVLFTLKLTAILFFAYIFVLLFINIGMDIGPNDKISMDYFMYIFNHKIEQISVWWNAAPVDAIMLGKFDVPYFPEIVSGDFYWLDYFITTGIFGVILFSFILYGNVRKSNAHAVIILILGTLHYPTIFSLPGQIIFACVLAGGSRYRRKSIGFDFGSSAGYHVKPCASGIATHSIRQDMVSGK